MFPKNTYLLPQAAPNSVVDSNGVEIQLHPQRDLFPGHHYLTQNGSLIEAANLVYGELNAPQKKLAAKKDRHSKIYTSQGPRDRRVRLSIGIARKFFDLQEMLGFDKPSKTLDWLLNKSKAAIKELVQTKKMVPVDDNSPSEYSKGKNVERRKEAMETHQISAKESRAKARARARERTKEKMCIKNLTSELNTGFDIHPVQNRNNQLEYLQLFSGSSSTNGSFLKSNSTIREPPVLQYHEEESNLIRRKSKNTCYSGIPQNVAASRDFCSNYTPSAENNWDNFTLEPNLFFILDQHKFINSTPNI